MRDATWPADSNTPVTVADARLAPCGGGLLETAGVPVPGHSARRGTAGL